MLLSTAKTFSMVVLSWFVAFNLGQFLGLPIVSFVIALGAGFLIAKSQSFEKLLDSNREMFAKIFGRGVYDAMGMLGAVAGFVAALGTSAVALFAELGADAHGVLGMIGLMPPFMLRQLTYFSALKNEDATQ